MIGKASAWMCVILFSFRRAKKESQGLSLGYLGNVVDLW